MRADTDREPEFSQRFSRAENQIRAYARRLLPDWTAVEDVLQDAYLVGWRKFHEFQGGCFSKWMCVIVRFEVLKYRRQCARSRIVFSDDVLQLLSEESELAESEEFFTVRLGALRRCLKSLDTEQRELIIAFYTAGVSTRQLAARTGRTENSIYKAMRRIRHRLLSCMRRNSELAS